MNFRNFFTSSILLICLINKAELAPLTCKLDDNPKQGYCVPMNSCPSFRIGDGILDPEFFAELKTRIANCASAGKKMLCCEDALTPPEGLMVTTKPTTTTTTTTKATPVTRVFSTTRRTANTATTNLVTKVFVTTRKPTSTQTKFEGPPMSHANFKLFDNTKCGTAGAADRVANGMDAGLFEFPWTARLAFISLKQDIIYGCGGSLITDQYVLTAAHCLTDLPKGRTLHKVRLGEHDETTDMDCIDENNCADPVQDIDVEEFFLHEGYDRQKLHHDIGLIRLKNKANLSQNNIRTVCLPFDPDVKKFGKNYIVVGWGATTNSSAYPVLQKASVPEFDSAKCQEKFKKKRDSIEITDSQLCAGGDGKVDSCRGDSGGPLQAPAFFMKGKLRVIQYGIVSYGVATCGVEEGFPGVYTRVSAYLNWIMDHMH